MRKLDSPGCHCQQEEQSGRHIVEGCPRLAELKRGVDELELAEWHTRHAGNRRKRKGDVGVEEEKEKVEGEKREKLADFF